MAEQYPANKPGDSVKPVTTERVVTRQGAENGAEVYPEPRKRGFPWWILLLGLIPLLLLAFNNRDRDQGRVATATPAATTTPYAASSPVASPSGIESPVGSDDLVAGTGAMAGAGAAASGDTSQSGSAALPPTGKDIKVYSGTDISAAPKGAASKQGETLSDVVAFSQVTDKSTLIDRKAKLTNVNVVEVLSPRALIVGPSTGQHMLVLLDNRLDAGTGNQKVSVAAGKPVSLVGIVKASPSEDVLTSQYGVSSDKIAAHTDDPVYLHATVAQEK